MPGQPSAGGTVSPGSGSDQKHLLDNITWHTLAGPHARYAVSTDEAPEAVRLGPQHASQALELATLTNPGPFGPRTIELGEYFGCFDGLRLIAMAGERMAFRVYRESVVRVVSPCR